MDAFCLRSDGITVTVNDTADACSTPYVSCVFHSSGGYIFIDKNSMDLDCRIRIVISNSLRTTLKYNFDNFDNIDNMAQNINNPKFTEFMNEFIIHLRRVTYVLGPELNQLLVDMFDEAMRWWDEFCQSLKRNKHILTLYRESLERDMSDISLVRCKSAKK